MRHSVTDFYYKDTVFQFFADKDCGAGQEGFVRLSPALLRHVRAARIGPQEPFTIVLPGGATLKVQLEGAPKGSAQVLGEVELSPESPLALSLYLGLSKPDVLEAAAAGATELGVGSIFLVTCARSPPARSAHSRIERLSRILRHAAEVAGRAKLPALEGPLSFEDATGALARFSGPRFVLWEETARSAPPFSGLLRRLPPSARIALFTGPEGGITPGEVERLKAAGCQVASLGPRILKAHTAPLAAVTLAQAAWGDLK